MLVTSYLAILDIALVLPFMIFVSS